MRNNPAREDSAPRSATQRDVAARAGVDRATVSRALDPDRRHLLTADTVRRVEAVVGELGYRPNTLARGLRRQRSNIVSLSMPRTLRDNNTGFIEGVEDRLRRDGVSLVVSFDDDSGLLQATTGLLDGSIVIVAETELNSRAVLTRPVVVVGYDRDAGLDVVIDQRQGMSRAVRHLHRLGHRRIALLCEPESSVVGSRHRRAFSDEIDQLGPSMSPTIATFLPRKPSSVPEACVHLLMSTPRPTAILITDGGAAAGCYGAAKGLGLSVPDDVSIMGYGDAGAAPYLVPPLTTIAVPTRVAGRRAAEILLDRIEGHVGASADLAPHLVQRSSTVEPRPEPSH